MKRCKVLFCDLDGTLIDTISGKTFPKGIWDMRIKFDVLDAIKRLSPSYVFIVTNQGGIEKGFVNQEDFESKLNYVTHVISEHLRGSSDFKLCKGVYCGVNDKLCLYRKPNSKMLSDCIRYYMSGDILPKDEILMIGDASGLDGQFSDTDKKTAENFGISYMDVNEFIKLYGDN